MQGRWHVVLLLWGYFSEFFCKTIANIFSPETEIFWTEEENKEDKDAGSGGKDQIQEGRLISELDFFNGRMMEKCNMEKIRV